MSKETNFLIFCMERYRYDKGMSGKEVAAFFEKYRLYDYVRRYFPVLHTMGDKALIEDIDDYIRSM